MQKSIYKCSETHLSPQAEPYTPRAEPLVQSAGSSAMAPHWMIAAVVVSRCDNAKLAAVSLKLKQIGNSAEMYRGAVRSGARFRSV